MKSFHPNVWGLERLFVSQSQIAACLLHLPCPAKELSAKAPEIGKDLCQTTTKEGLGQLLWCP